MLDRDQLVDGKLESRRRVSLSIEDLVQFVVALLRARRVAEVQVALFKLGSD